MGLGLGLRLGLGMGMGLRTRVRAELRLGWRLAVRRCLAKRVSERLDLDGRRFVGHHLHHRIGHRRGSRAVRGAHTQPE